MVTDQAPHWAAMAGNLLRTLAGILGAGHVLCDRRSAPATNTTGAAAGAATRSRSSVRPTPAPATLGGLVACDAGALRALRHCTARRQLAGIEVVALPAES
jgi:FAD/FMN-containing dehydrogenase